MKVSDFWLWRVRIKVSIAHPVQPNGNVQVHPAGIVSQASAAENFLTYHPRRSMKDTTSTVLKEENDQTKEIFRFTGIPAYI